MTKEEREKFEKTMRNASQTLNNEMSQLQKTLNESLKNVHTHLGDGFLNGLNQNLNQLGNVLDSGKFHVLDSFINVLLTYIYVTIKK